MSVTLVADGRIRKTFTVNANGGKVEFSSGNLQYIGSAATPYWKFADMQTYYLGANGQENGTQNIDRDLFGWGTSGWNNGNTYYQPWNAESAVSYAPYYGPSGIYDLTGDYANADWGVYNAISNGGNTAGQWRTLTIDEWNYVINQRSTTSGIRFAKATVNDVKGVILLPDDWSSSIYALEFTNDATSDYGSGDNYKNYISLANWAVMEKAGAVFLPAGGYRDESNSIASPGQEGNYWSSTARLEGSTASSEARSLFFHASNVFATNNDYRSYGLSVRLVRDAE